MTCNDCGRFLLNSSHNNSRWPLTDLRELCQWTRTSTACYTAEWCTFDIYTNPNWCLRLHLVCKREQALMWVPNGRMDVRCCHGTLRTVANDADLYKTQICSNNSKPKTKLVNTFRSLMMTTTTMAMANGRNVIQSSLVQSRYYCILFERFYVFFIRCTDAESQSIQPAQHKHTHTHAANCKSLAIIKDTPWARLLPALVCARVCVCALWYPFAIHHSIIYLYS